MNNLKGRKSGNGLQKALCCFLSLSTFFLALSPVTHPVTPLLIVCLRTNSFILVFCKLSLPSEGVLAGKSGICLML